MKNKDFKIISVISYILFILCYILYLFYNGRIEIIDTIRNVIFSIIVPFYMFSFGISKHDEGLKDLKDESIKLIIIGFIINILCYCSPMFISYILGNNTIFNNMITSILRINIIIFIGIFELIIYLFKKYKFSFQSIFGISLLISIISSILSYKLGSFNSIFLSSLINMLYSTSTNEGLSILSFLIIPVSGYIFGNFIEENESKKTIITIIIISIIMSIFMFIYIESYFKMINNFYNINIYSSILYIFISLILYILIYLIRDLIHIKNIDKLNNSLLGIFVFNIFVINYSFYSLFDGLINLSLLELIIIYVILMIIDFLVIKIYDKTIYK